MRANKRNDYRVVKTTRRTGEQVWKVTVGGTETVSTCTSIEQAQALAKNLNLDPWFLDRGNTRADRNRVAS